MCLVWRRWVTRRRTVRNRIPLKILHAKHIHDDDVDDVTSMMMTTTATMMMMSQCTPHAHSYKNKKKHIVFVIWYFIWNIKKIQFLLSQDLAISFLVRNVPLSYIVCACLILKISLQENWFDTVTLVAFYVRLLILPFSFKIKKIAKLFLRIALISLINY